MVPILTLLFILFYSVCSFYKAKTAKVFKKTSFIVFILVAYLIFPWGYLGLKGKTTGRFNQVSTFSYPEVQRSLNQSISEAGTFGINPYIVRVFHNKLVAYTQDVSLRHLAFFSPHIVLFDSTLPDRYKIPHVGMITLVEYFGFLLAVYFLIKKRGCPLRLFPLAALLIAPLPSSITFEAFPNFQRALYLLPFWQILAGYGIWTFLAQLKAKSKLIFTTFILISLVWSTGFFLFQYFLIAQVHENFSRDYEKKEISIFLGVEGKNYKKIAISDSSGLYNFYLFFNEFDIFEHTVVKEQKYFQGNFSIDNIYFQKEKCSILDDFVSKKFDLVILHESCKTYAFNRNIKEFRRKDTSLVYVAYETDKDQLERVIMQNTKVTDCLKLSDTRNKKLECEKMYLF